MKKRTLRESLERLQELDFVPGVSMAVPDANYTLSQRNFHPWEEPTEWPYEDDASTVGGPANATGDTGQSGVGRGGVGMGGRADVSGGTRVPSGEYEKTWQQDESPDYDEEQRHGLDKYRNVWRDTPDGKEWTKLNNEAMGMPMQIGPVPPMDGPQHDVLHFSSGTEEEDMLAAQDNRGPATQWGGPSTIPGQSRGWAASTTIGDDPGSVWKVPDEKEDDNMKMHEFFCPEPVPVEEIDNPDQDGLKDQSDADIEPDHEEHEEELDGPEGLTDLGVEPGDGFEPERPDPGFTGRLGGTSIKIVPKMGPAGEFVGSPDQMGAARGTYGMHTDGKQTQDLVDKRSAWDVIELLVQNLKNSGEDL
jgi:hypothetical protein